MLVLSRKGGEQLNIGHDITVTVLSIQGNRVKIGIEAPGDYRIIRAELSDWAEREDTADADHQAPLWAARHRLPRELAAH